jgi:hypothetical protein
VAIIQLPVDNVKSQGFLFSKYNALLILLDNCCGINAEVAENAHTFEWFLTLFRTLQSCMCSTPRRYKQSQSILCACLQFQHSSLHYFGSSVDLQNKKKRKKKSVP